LFFRCLAIFCRFVLLKMYNCIIFKSTKNPTPANKKAIRLDGVYRRKDEGFDCQFACGKLYGSHQFLNW